MQKNSIPIKYQPCTHQPQRTQAWQLRYFVDLNEGRVVDLARVKALLAQQG